MLPVANYGNECQRTSYRSCFRKCTFTFFFFCNYMAFLCLSWYNLLSCSAAVACVGAFYEKMGRMLGSSFPDTINNLMKALKSAEVGVGPIPFNSLLSQRVPFYLQFDFIGAVPRKRGDPPQLAEGAEWTGWSCSFMSQRYLQKRSLFAHGQVYGCALYSS